MPLVTLRQVLDHARIPHTHLVMHGSSSVPQEWLTVIRANGGEMKETFGVPVEEIQRGIRNGVRKVNIDTDIRLAMTGAVRRSLARDPSNFDPRAFLQEAVAAAGALCKERFEAFGCAGMGSRVKPIPLERMAERYGRREEHQAA
jgi:fructose-bisphosphate aldolase class II